MTDAQEFDLQASAMPMVTIYSDGSFKPALGTGGYGTIMSCNGYSRFFYGGFVGTSNNAMELLGPLSALRTLTCPCHVTIMSDSQYVVKGINDYLLKWAANKWRKADGGVIANRELWIEMFHFTQYHIINAVWIKGHSSCFGNSICDNLATIGTYRAAGINNIPSGLIDRV